MFKKFIAGAVALSPVALFAQESGGSVTIDLDKAGDVASAMGTEVQSLLTGDVMTAILAVVGASLAIWAVFLVVRFIRRAA